MGYNSFLTLGVIGAVAIISLFSIFLVFKRSTVFYISLIVFISTLLSSLLTYSVHETGASSMYIIISASIVLTVLSIIFSKQLIHMPIKRLTVNIKNISKGILDTDVDRNITDKRDEIGDLANAISETQIGLHNTAEFAKSLSEKEYHSIKYKPLSNDDEIGNMLLKMRNSLIESEKSEKLRKTEEQNATFVTTGIAKFAEILRLYNDDLTKLGDIFIRELVNYIGAIQGGLFVLNNENKEKEEFYELISAVAFERKKKINANFQIGDGLVGKCAFEKESIYLTDIPEDYMNITSGLGTSNPKNLLLTPAIVDGKVFAIVEISSFNPIEKHMIELIEKISENIAATFSNVKGSIHNMRLLEESKKYSEEMAAQEEELRQNIEELQATQEEMRRKENQLKTISEQLEKQENLIKEKITQLKYAN